MEHGGGLRSLDRPINTITTAKGGAHALCEPCLLPQQSDGRLRPVSEPVPTVAAAGAIALIEPFLVEYYGTGGARSVDEPLGTATTKPRFALVQPDVSHGGKTYKMDVRFRMLQPAELAGAQGFPHGYMFSGNKTEVVRQIGNAVPCGLSRALVKAVLEGGVA
jgi:DNA (cytosine-5)-methyltransferase 1